MKIIILGDKYVGKTCLASFYVRNTFDSRYRATIGLDYHFKRNPMGDLRIWDTDGYTNDVYPALFANTDAFLLTYSIDSKKSFTKIEELHSKLVKHYGENMPSLILVGLKADLEDERVVSKDAVADFSTKFQIKSMICSAKNGKGIKEVFNTVISLVVNSKTPLKELDQDHKEAVKKLGTMDIKESSEKAFFDRPKVQIPNTLQGLQQGSEIEMTDWKNSM